MQYNETDLVVHVPTLRVLSEPKIGEVGCYYVSWSGLSWAGNAPIDWEVIPRAEWCLGHRSWSAEAMTEPLIRVDDPDGGGDPLLVPLGSEPAAKRLRRQGGHPAGPLTEREASAYDSYGRVRTYRVRAPEDVRVRRADILRMGGADEDVGLEYADIPDDASRYLRLLGCAAIRRGSKIVIARKCGGYLTPTAWQPTELSDDVSSWDLRLIAQEISWVTPVDEPEDDYYAVIYRRDLGYWCPSARSDGAVWIATIHEDMDRGYETYPVIWEGGDAGIHGWVPAAGIRPWIPAK